MNAQLRCKAPSGLQAEFVCQRFPTDRVARTDFVGGRGSGKTVGGVLLALRAAVENPGSPGLVLAPTHKTLKRSWLKAWEQIVDPSLFRVNRSEMFIKMINGTVIFLSSRHIDNPERGKDADRGESVAWVVDDEAALGFDQELYANVSAAIRAPANYRFYATLTTPRLLGGYRELIESPDHFVVHSTSRQNEHLPSWWVDDLAKTMSPMQIRREIDGEFVALEGLVWPYWSTERWPNGNVHDHKFDPSRPWFLFADYGVANGAYLVMQQITGERLNDSFPVWVIVGELMPRSDGSAARCFERLNQAFGKPAAIYCGADANTRSNADAKTPFYFARQIWGGVHVFPISGFLADKQVQHDRASFAILDSIGKRRLAVSSGLVDLEPGHGRGSRELFAQDVWPEKGKNLLAKDGRLEHIRDALLYGVVGVVAPPSMEHKPVRAA